MWQGTVAVTGSGTPDIILVQLVTPALHLAVVYRDILLGVAHALTFTDPTKPAEETWISEEDRNRNGLRILE